MLRDLFCLVCLATNEGGRPAREPRTYDPLHRAHCGCSTARSGRAAAREPPLGLVETEDQQPAALVEILRD